MQSIYAPIERQAARAAANAKDGAVTIGEQTYLLTFDAREWVYAVTDADGEPVARFNTKTLANAKRMLREWLAS